MKRITVTLSLLIILCGLQAQEPKKDYSQALELVEVWLDAQKDFDRLPGISAIVIDDQEVLWSGAVGYSNPDKQVKASPHSLYSICSISKLFTSVAIMKLYDEGKLRLDDKVSDLLPNYNLQQQYPSSGPITVRSLLTHSSGLPREAAFPYWTGPDFPFPSTEDVDAKLKDQETLYPAATYFQYSNLGLTLLGQIVEEVSGQAYNDYIDQNIIKPLGLSNTRTELPKKLYGKELAQGYSALSREGARDKVNFFVANGITPAAGFSSNVHDLGKFASWQFRLRDSTINEILRPSTLKYMQNVHWTNPNWKTTWGLGFVVYKGANGSTWVGHGGNCPGYQTTLQLDLKNKRAYSVMINANGSNPSKYLKGIDAILNLVKASKKETGEITKLNDFVGYYSAKPWGSEVYVGILNGKLCTMPLPRDKPAEAITFYKHIEGDTFRRIRDNKDLGETLYFQRDEDGNILSYKSHGNYTKRINR
ncbi:serine hydrolase [Carboxylicivirga sp. M1479]|uniref:serine hydrolase domain-containing protein n=1 Tax=Carboxylicivirga sp. M1479 TaxID=2594476 RepID=UPI001177DDDE|nr:serine hydrolase domain-containing protein [Carboxylicivirga sp. M1479]TRX70817.1 beta-lactamase family protein [Carboxylicivirga sp. M1479]